MSYNLTAPDQLRVELIDSEIVSNNMSSITTPHKKGMIAVENCTISSSAVDNIITIDSSRNCTVSNIGLTGLAKIINSESSNITNSNAVIIGSTASNISGCLSCGDFNSRSSTITSSDFSNIFGCTGCSISNSNSGFISGSRSSSSISGNFSSLISSISSNINGGPSGTNCGVILGCVISNISNSVEGKDQNVLISSQDVSIFDGTNDSIISSSASTLTGGNSSNILSTNNSDLMDCSNTNIISSSFVNIERSDFSHMISSTGSSITGNTGFGITTISNNFNSIEGSTDCFVNNHFNASIKESISSSINRSGTGSAPRCNVLLGVTGSNIGTTGDNSVSNCLITSASNSQIYNASTSNIQGSRNCSISKVVDSSIISSSSSSISNEVGTSAISDTIISSINSFVEGIRFITIMNSSNSDAIYTTTTPLTPGSPDGASIISCSDNCHFKCDDLNEIASCVIEGSESSTINVGQRAKIGQSTNCTGTFVNNSSILTSTDSFQNLCSFSNILGSTGITMANCSFDTIISSSSVFTDGTGTTGYQSTIASFSGIYNNNGFHHTTALSSDVGILTLQPRASHTIIGGTTGLVGNPMTFEINCDLGTITSVGAIVGNSVFPGLQELMSNFIEGEIPPGRLLRMVKGSKVRICKSDEKPHLVSRVNKNLSFVGGESSFNWCGAYLKSPLGYYPMKKELDLTFENIRNEKMNMLNDLNTSQETKDEITLWLNNNPSRYFEERQVNPNYNPNASYASRSERSDQYTACEWSGRAPVFVELDVVEETYLISGEGGIGKTSSIPTRVYVLEIINLLNLDDKYIVDDYILPMCGLYNIAICAIGDF